MLDTESKTVSGSEESLARTIREGAEKCPNQRIKIGDNNSRLLYFQLNTQIGTKTVRDQIEENLSLNSEVHGTSRVPPPSIAWISSAKKEKFLLHFAKRFPATLGAQRWVWVAWRGNPIVGWTGPQCPVNALLACCEDTSFQRYHTVIPDRKWENRRELRRSPVVEQSVRNQLLLLMESESTNQYASQTTIDTNRLIQLGLSHPVLSFSGAKYATRFRHSKRLTPAPH